MSGCEKTTCLTCYPLQFLFQTQRDACNQPARRVKSHQLRPPFDVGPEIPTAEQNFVLI